MLVTFRHRFVDLRAHNTGPVGVDRKPMSFTSSYDLLRVSTSLYEFLRSFPTRYFARLRVSTSLYEFLRSFPTRYFARVRGYSFMYDFLRLIT
jgi:hypothetical protein